MRYLRAASAVLLAFVLLAAASIKSEAIDAQGKIFRTDIEFSELAITKRGLTVKLTNTSDVPIKISSKLMFFDKSGNSVGYALFGLREIPSGTFVIFSGVPLKGSWKQCRDAPRWDWQTMTYEILY